MSKKAKFVNICPIFITDDIQRTMQFYIDKLGFQYADHMRNATSFATLYRDEIEIVLVKKDYGEIQTNSVRYGAGYDAYIDPDSVAAVDVFYQEFHQKGVKILEKPHLTSYGSYEFVLEDIDGRKIGIGRVADQNKFFKDSNYHK